jgi:hypothetical protein
MFSILLLLMTASARAENIDPFDEGSQYAYGENVGWLNFEPSQGPGVTVSDTQLTGYAWAENVGWINLSPTSYGGVVNDGTGQLSGHAWGENVGWINFNPQVLGDPTHYGVTIDSNGYFSGWAWGENIGWINFDPQVQGDPAHYGVRTSWQGGGCFYVGKADACGHVVTQADYDRWVSLGSPDCWCDPCHCRGDANGDCVINAVDVLALRAAWPGSGGAYDPCVDINYDGAINAVDVLALRAAWPGLGGPGCNGVPGCP